MTVLHVICGLPPPPPPSQKSWIRLCAAVTSKLFSRVCCKQFWIGIIHLESTKQVTFHWRRIAAHIFTKWPVFSKIVSQKNFGRVWLYVTKLIQWSVSKPLKWCCRLHFHASASMDFLLWQKLKAKDLELTMKCVFVWQYRTSFRSSLFWKTGAPIALKFAKKV